VPLREHGGSISVIYSHESCSFVSPGVKLLSKDFCTQALFFLFDFYCRCCYVLDPRIRLSFSGSRFTHVVGFQSRLPSVR
jgi:hypothetical protein